MNKEIVKYASLCLEDKEYIYLLEQIEKKQYNKARLFVERCIDSLELVISISEINDSIVLKKQLEHLLILENEVLNLFYEENKYAENK